MTETQNYIKENWLTLANFILLLGLAYNIGSFTQEVRESIKMNKEAIEELRIETLQHRDDKISHSPYERNATLFVPRTEIDVRLENIEANQTKSAAVQDKIYNKLMQDN